MVLGLGDRAGGGERGGVGVVEDLYIYNLYRVQIQRWNNLLDHADRTGPTRSW